MTAQEYVVAATKLSMEEAFRYIRVVPAEKLDWKPLETGQSVLSMARELAKCPDWAYGILSSEDLSESASDWQDWATLDDCEAALAPKLERFCNFVAAFPAERLHETKDLPFGPGGSMKTFPMWELLDYPRWNASYHQGQIAYIQTLYGDKDLH